MGCDAAHSTKPMHLLDEPTSALDVAHQHELLALIRDLNQSLGLTVIMVLHDVQYGRQIQ